MAFVEVNPAYAELFRRHWLTTARDFLTWSGVVVGGHADRCTLRVALNGKQEFFLKKEHIVPWRDRFASVWEGHGFASKSVREGRLLQQAQRAGIGCPEVAALGEDGPRAFLLVRAEEGLTDLRTYLAQPLPAGEQRKLAQALGRALAGLHAAGFDHPDLYAKHVLAGKDGDRFRFCFLDWQRSRRRRTVRWRHRFRDLAALDASLSDALASPRLRLVCLRAYLGSAMPLRRPAVAIRFISARLLRRRKVRALRQERQVAS